MLHAKNDWIVMQWLNLLSFEFDLTAPFKQNKSYSYIHIYLSELLIVLNIFINMLSLIWYTGIRMTELAKWLSNMKFIFSIHALENGVFVEFIKLIINGEFNFDSTSQTDFQLDYVHKADSDSDSKVDFTRIKQLTTMYIHLNGKSVTRHLGVIFNAIALHFTHFLTTGKYSP